ncbi:hypothetical protein CPC08DRAFT_753708 [Agrocybe pediades]|nr:hypothetical protein CPC08DRAFT_753708 [Agrocybe pediades]
MKNPPSPCTSRSSNPPQKRRRLVLDDTPSSASLAAPSKEENQGRSMIPVGRGVCTSCHRAVGNAIQCARCSTTICTVCSRHCTHSASSHPPTPNLTWSPSPPASVSDSPKHLRSTPSSAGRPDLNLSEAPSTSSTTRQDSIGHGVKRQHKLLDDTDEHVNPACVKSTAQDSALLFLAGVNLKLRKGLQDEFGPGCGRTVCNKCCYEDVLTSTTTCLDCYGSQP